METTEILVRQDCEFDEADYARPVSPDDPIFRTPTRPEESAKYEMYLNGGPQSSPHAVTELQRSYYRAENNYGYHYIPVDPNCLLQRYSSFRDRTPSGWGPPKKEPQINKLSCMKGESLKTDGRICKNKTKCTDNKRSRKQVDLKST